jgi:hypothetical protein
MIPPEASEGSRSDSTVSVKAIHAAAAESNARLIVTVADIVRKRALS